VPRPRAVAAFTVAVACAWGASAGAPAALAGKCDPTVTPSFKDVTYTRLPDGVTPLKLDIYVPAGGGPFPAMVVIDGGSWKSSCKEDVGPDAKRLSQQGFVAFAPNVRRACGRRSKYCNWHAPALEWIRSHASTYKVDAAKVGAMGISSGGQLAYMLGETGSPGSTRPEAVAGFSGDADLPYACEQGVLGVCDDRTNYIGCSLSACRSTWLANDPTSLASGSAAPTFIAAGTNDTRVRFPEAQHLNAALSGAGATVRLCSIKTGEHSQDLYPLPCQGGSQTSWDAMVAFMHGQLG
jgi:acetyl esterase/lipase